MAQETYSEAAAKLTRGQLLDLLLELEDRFRALIRAVFQREERDWIKLIPGSIRAALQETASSAAAMIGAGADLLDRASLKQLIDIASSQWKLFEPVLQDKVWLQANLEELRVARNSLAHGAQPGPDEKVKIALTAQAVGKRIPAIGAPAGLPFQPKGTALIGTRVLWVDDRPEGNTWARRLLSNFGAEVIPALTNDEAIDEAERITFDVIVSDIDRGEGEPGTQLGIRLKAAGQDIPIVFFIARLDPKLALPAGAVHISNDMVAMLTCVLSLLRPDAVGHR